VHVVRDKRDTDLLAAELKPGARLLVVGGGYIGLEAAAVARHLGLEVTLIEMADRILKRVAAEETSSALRAIHRARGVDIREQTGLRRLIGRDGRLVAAELADGQQFDIDIAIVGIGVTPGDRLAEQAGLSVANGIVVDQQGRSSDPAIFACGDCTILPWQGRMIRLESVQNAVDQAEVVASVIAGQDAIYDPRPWFWSDQYDVKLQIAGYNEGYNHVVTRPGARDGALSVWYFAQERLLAVDALNDAKAYVTGKKLIDSGRTVAPGFVADPQNDLRQLLA
jgi:3-phenylpropionate/trans-cinnamate dioxygenase ferredoxin reductase component